MLHANAQFFAMLSSSLRTGLVLSHGPKPLCVSTGFTTFIEPPKSYIASYLTSQTFHDAPPSFTKEPLLGISKRLKDVLADFVDDGITVDMVRNANCWQY